MASDRSNPLVIEFGSLDSGLSVARQPAPAGAASFSATYVGPAGWGYDPPNEAGVARVANQLLTSGAGPFDRRSLARALDRAGATLTSECAPESAEVTVWGPAADWRKLLGLLADAVLRPRYAADDLTRVRRQLIERQLRELAQPASRADRELFREIYPDGHPYRTSGLGDRRSAARLSRGRLKQFHRAHYTAPGGRLVVTGPARLPELLREARRRFSDLATEAPPVLRFPAPRPPSRRSVSTPLPGRSQVEVRIGGDSISRSSELYPASFLANEVLGGRGTLSRLFRKVREEGGLVYHASSEIEAMRFGGHWSVAAGTGADRYPKVVRMVEREIARIETSVVLSGELNEVRESAIGELPLALESTADAHELAVDVAYHELPGDYLLRWPKVLREVTPREVRRAAETSMDRRRAVTVLAGPISR